MRVIGVLLLSIVMLGCTKLGSNSSIKIQMPSRSSIQNSVKSLAALPANKKICFGVNVTGEGISNASLLTCGGVGLVSGFVGEGETLTVNEVPRGPKNFELFVYLANVGESCPVLAPASMNNATEKAKIFSSGSASQDIYGDTTLTIALNFPGEEYALSTKTCGTLKAKLKTHGELVDAADGLLAVASPVAEGFFKTPASGPINFGVLSSGGYINIASDNLQVPGSVSSMTQKPDSGAYYGLQHDGTIVKLNLTSGVLSIEAIDPAACPFETANCKVPLWMQSISAGYSRELYGLDHSGAVHYLGANGPVATGTNVGPAVSQVSYY